MENALRESQFDVQPVVAAVEGGVEGARLFSYDGAGGRTEAEYVAVGSGTPYAYGHLEDAYGSGQTVAAATDLAESIVAAATERDTASGNGRCLAVVREDGVEIDIAETIGVYARMTRGLKKRTRRSNSSTISAAATWS